MKLIKELKQNNYTLKHYRYIDDLGFKRDSLEVVILNKDGTLTLVPFLGEMKVKTYSRKDNIFDTTISYTNKEYKNMLDKVIHSFKLQ